MVESLASPQNTFMNNFEKLAVTLVALLSVACIGAWMLWNYMISSIV
jgi:nitrate reductase NapE component